MRLRINTPAMICEAFMLMLHELSSLRTVSLASFSVLLLRSGRQDLLAVVELA